MKLVITRLLRRGTSKLSLSLKIPELLPMVELQINEKADFTKENRIIPPSHGYSDPGIATTAKGQGKGEVPMKAFQRLYISD